jgi:hypothetical protein
MNEWKMKGKTWGNKKSLMESHNKQFRVTKVTRMARLQPESLAGGNWLVKQNQPVSKIKTKSGTNLRSLYESWFRNALISKSVILWWQAKKGINPELEGADACRVLNIPSKRSLYLMRSSNTSAHLQKKSTYARTTMPFARLYFQMVCTQSEPARFPQHMFVQILVQVGAVQGC